MPTANTHGGRRPGAGPKVRLLKLTPAESMLVIDALNGVIVTPELAEQQIWMEVQDAITLDHLDTKWNVDGTALVNTLKKLSHETALELVEQVNRFWQKT